MTREYKFRAWDERAEVMLYSDKDYEECTFVCESEGHLKCYVPEEVPATLDEPSHVVGREIFEIMEFTGLRDSKRTPEFPEGQEIYEGDKIQGLVSLDEYSAPYLVHGTVSWDNDFSAWIFSKPKIPVQNYHFMLWQIDQIEVIGNIYDHK